jgi:succinyl-diaminopimelate desuccinylase
LVAELSALAAVAGGGDLPTRVTVTNDRAPMTTPREAPIVEAACAVVEETLGEPAAVVAQHAFTDASKFVPLGVDQLILGPGRPEEAHCPNEGIAVSQYLTGIAVFERLARRHLGAAR